MPDVQTTTLTVDADREPALPAGSFRPGVVVDQGLVLPAPAGRITVTGVELTQSTQYAGMDGTRWGAPGAVPLVARKTTLVRAFCAVDEQLVRAGKAVPPRDGERITAGLRVRRNGTGIYRTGPTNPAGVLLGYPGELDRELFDHEEIYWTTVGDGLSEQFMQVRSIPPLEFVIPGWHCPAGTVQLVLDLAGEPTPWLGKASFVEVHVPTVNVVGTDPAGVAATVAAAERMLPVPSLPYRILGPHLGDLALARIFTGLLGLGDIVFDHAVDLAQELGHRFGRRHVADDPGYPTYLGGRADSVGEVGVDIATRTVYRPGGSSDLMSAGSRRWISPYTYSGILDALREGPAPPATRRLLVLGVRLRRNGTVEVRTAIPVNAPGPAPRVSGRSPLSVDVVDAAGTVLCTHHFRDAAGEPEDRAAWRDLADAVEWDGPAAGLAFHTGGEPLAQMAVGEAPEVDLSEPRVRSRAIHAVWVTRHPRVRPHVVVLYSADDGATWQPVAFAGGTDGEVELPTDTVPGGPRCRLRVIASAELAAAEVVSPPFAVPVTPRAVAIVSPVEGATLPARDPVPLAASAYSPDFGPCPPDELAWESDVDGPLGYGAQVAVPLRPGEHRITVTASDGTGGRCSATARVTVRG